MNTISSIMLHDPLLSDEVCSLLGSPHSAGDGYAIYCADSLSALRKLPADIFALTVTSPPYNIGKEYETPLPLEKYLGWCEQWIQEVYRVTRPDGAFWLNVGYVEMPGRAKALRTALKQNKESVGLIAKILGKQHQRKQRLFHTDGEEGRSAILSRRAAGVRKNCLTVTNWLTI